MMSKKDYDAIAEAIKTSPDMSALVIKLCVYFRKDNPKFDEIKFIDACVETRR